MQYEDQNPKPEAIEVSWNSVNTLAGTWGMKGNLYTSLHIQ